MSEALPLPPRPNLEQYRKLAKDFQAASKVRDPAPVRDWYATWVEKITRLRGITITPELQRQFQLQGARISERWHDDRPAHCSLTDAQHFLARAHGFANWPKFAAHLEAMSRAQSSASHFESAVDAIVTGDLDRVSALIHESRDLVRLRSNREHRSTLLHYVSANGVEDFRQKTPSNIVEIAALLLDDGADVNAESDAYAGHSTTLHLTATSYHPEAAGVQIPLLQLLLDRGALIDVPDGGSPVNACLHNGRGKAAEFLAGKGASLDLEGAAGVGRLDLVETLLPSAPPSKVMAGLEWACEFGRLAVVEYLLDHGGPLDNGQLGLHWAAHEGHVDIVKLLLSRGASVHTRDARFDGTPLAWALHAFTERGPRDAYYEVANLLVKAGAQPDPHGDTISDPRMRAALTV